MISFEVDAQDLDHIDRLLGLTHKDDCDMGVDCSCGKVEEAVETIEGSRAEIIESIHKSAVATRVPAELQTGIDLEFQVLQATKARYRAGRVLRDLEAALGENRKEARHKKWREKGVEIAGGWAGTSFQQSRDQPSLSLHKRTDAISAIRSFEVRFGDDDLRIIEEHNPGLVSKIDQAFATGDMPTMLVALGAAAKVIQDAGFIWDSRGEGDGRLLKGTKGVKRLE